METRRCPMCGQPNPPEAEKCRYCEARIKPLWEENGEEPVNIDYFSSKDDQDQEIPEWLRSLRSGAEESKPEEEQTPPPFEFEGEEISDWEKWVQPAEEQADEGEAVVQSVPPFLMDLEAEETSQELPAETLPAEVPEETKMEEFEEPEFPKWLETLPGQEWDAWSESGEEEKENVDFEGAVPPFVSVDESLLEEASPEWLQEDLKPEEETPLETTVPPFSEPEEGELPAWLKSIGAEEAAETPPAQPSVKVELAGPLYGLKDILPAEPLVAEQKAPASVLTQLIVSEKQQVQADLFAQLISQEGTPKPIKQEGGIKPQTLWRVVIFLVLLMAAVTGILLNPFPTQPSELNVGVFDTMQVISQLPPNAAVLVIVDYEAGDFAEMQAIAYEIIDQLMVKSAYLVFVSTHPTGALQADRLVRDVNRQGEHSYQEFSNWVNLGYLPGGAMGIQLFAQSPRSLLPNAVDGQSGWQNLSLQNVQRLSDFSLVLLLSENSSRARNWVEQMQGLIDPARIVLAVSAQSEPVMRAYYETSPRQVQGLVSGLGGGATYETQAGRRGAAMQLWDSFGLTVSVAVSLIAIGSLFNLMVTLLRWTSRAQGGKR